MQAEIESISAVTFVTGDMASAVRFYRDLGLILARGDENATFSTFRAGTQYLNLSVENCNEQRTCGRIIFYVTDVDAFYQRCLQHNIKPEFEPRDAEWGERYFHVLDPDGHEISFAKPLTSAT